MMRSLWTAASGMVTQQAYVDTIANNLANVNTIGFKKERLEFKTLLYETMREASSTTTGGSPMNLQVGHGVRAAGTSKTFTGGNYENTDNPLDFAIEGNGFFAISGNNGEEVYSKDGTFKMVLSGTELMLTTSDGYPVKNTEGGNVILPGTTRLENLNVDAQGKFTSMEGGVMVDLGQQMKIVQFKNTAGLKATGNNFYQVTAATGPAIMEQDSTDLLKSSVVQGTLEASNVAVVEEMVKMIVAQRAYEISSKAIQTSDEMLAKANELKR